jgi:hypothetical protein
MQQTEENSPDLNYSHVLQFVASVAHFACGKEQCNELIQLKASRNRKNIFDLMKEQKKSGK